MCHADELPSKTVAAVGHEGRITFFRERIACAELARTEGIVDRRGEMIDRIRRGGVAVDNKQSWASQ